MTLHHPTVLLVSIVVTLSMAINQLSFGYLVKKYTPSRDMAIGTFTYSLLCIYYLFEPSLAKGFGVISVILIATNVFFLYRSSRGDMGYTPHDRFDVLFASLAMVLGVAVILTQSFAVQQLAYSVYVLILFGKAIFLAFRVRKQRSLILFISSLLFLVLFLILFIFRNLLYLGHAPTATVYSLESLSAFTSFALLTLYANANIGVLVSAAQRAERKSRAALDEVVEEKVFATDLVQIISHDLSGYLGSIGVSIPLIGKDDESARYLIGSSSERAKNLLTDLVYWGRSRMGTQDGLSDLVLTEDLVQKVAGDVLFVAESKGVGIENTISGSSGILNIDGTAARVVLRNLLSNAVKFAPPGTNVRISMRDRRDSVGITVSDCGLGMDEKTVSDVRAGLLVRSREGSTGELGTGTGLRIVTTICNTFRWPLDIKSNSGSGTDITLSLPKYQVDLNEENQ